MDIFSKYNYEEICVDLGINIEDLLCLIEKKTIPKQIERAEYTIVHVTEKFKKLIKQQQVNGRKSLQTVRYYINFINRFEQFVYKVNPEMSIYSLNESLFDDFLLTCQPRQETVLSPGTINTYIGILRRLLSFAHYEGYLDKDLRYRFERHSTKLLPRYYQDSHLKAMLEMTKRKTHAYLWSTILWFLLGTGCRVSELINVRVKDFDIETNLLYTVGKGRKERYIPIYPHIKEIVLEYLYLTGVKEWNKGLTGYLFARDHGVKRERKLSVRSVQYQVHDIITKLGFDRRFNVHSFRHTFAVNCLRAGMKIEYLSQILGHDNPATTYTYIQLLPIDLKSEIMNKFPFPLEKLVHQIYGTGVYEHGQHSDGDRPIYH
ncbi:site-specific integrase [Brevibacillus sp. DP1.3A]|uniref:tyrosine-type recombinase/integrase n=1 Tax=Brevibacillus sp. DP1.3A TaxID=2738867 RepID=UPI00156B8058|nr:site-specific integrase [Brevibacillus sp. DP1.3A]UED72186.1 tyrosine-type recombinase/integrase [Brevibacillus sp. DP1.3A]